MKLESLESEQQTARDLLGEGATILDGAGITGARLEAEALLRHVMGLEQADFYLMLGRPVPADCRLFFRSLLLRRARREPLAYLAGRKEFWSLDFMVTPDVLIPRPETEVLVETALKRMRQRSAGLPVRILDLGTGSGAIAVSLAKELPAAEVTAVDFSLGALRIARTNCERHGVRDRVRLVASDLFGAIKQDRIKFDLIVSNPPYIEAGMLSQLMAEVRDWEPRKALDGGSDGLDFYRRIVPESRAHLASGGQLVLEIGDGTGRSVMQLIERFACYGPASVERDLSGRERVVVAEKMDGREDVRRGSDRG